KKIILIPHGIDTSHFKATPRLRKLRFKEPYRRFKKIFLSVGSYGATDYNLEQIIKKFKDAMFIFIGSKFEPKQKYPNLLIYKNISEERLIEFYSICDYFIKPLRFASA